MNIKRWLSKRKPPFVIIGQERSGTTLVQSLLSSHPDILCRGELFDPWQIDDSGEKIKDQSAVFARDNSPAEFLKSKLAGKGLKSPVPSILGFKLLTQHNPKVLLEVVPNNPDWKIIHIRRDNKLAQFASRQQVNKSGEWTSSQNKGEAPLIQVAPMWAMAQCNSLKLEDELLRNYLTQLPNPVLEAEYATLGSKETHRALIEFLGAEKQAELSSGLKKQGQNKVSERFKNAKEIEEQFAGSGLGKWLEEELA